MPASIYGLTGSSPAGSGLSGQRIPFSWESCLLLQKSDSRKSFLFFIFHFPLFQSSFHTMTHFGHSWIISWTASVSSLNGIRCLATFQKMCHLIQHLNALPHTCPILIVSLGLSLKISFILEHEINLKCSRYIPVTPHVSEQTRTTTGKGDTDFIPRLEKSLTAFEFLPVPSFKLHRKETWALL